MTKFAFMIFTFALVFVLSMVLPETMLQFHCSSQILTTGFKVMKNPKQNNPDYPSGVSYYDSPAVYDIKMPSAVVSNEQSVSVEKWKKQVQEIATQKPKEVFLSGAKFTKRICITFDDGPDNVVTPEILDILKANNVKASFFFVGEAIHNYRSVVKRTYEEGNLVLNHSFSHSELTRLSIQEIKNEILKTNAAIREVTGKTPAILRPPYGAINNKVISQAKNENERIVLWTIDTLDWLHRNPNYIEQSILKYVKPGDIILMHSNSDKRSSAKALPGIISKLRSNGYEFVDISELLGIKAYQ